MITRREFSKSILAGSTALLASEKPLPAGDVPGSPDQNPNQECDLLIKGGTVIDPSQHLHGPMDVAVKNRKILEVSRDIPESRARHVFSAKGKIVTPGLIDIHVHCYYGVGEGIDADHYCLSKGVTTVVDAGSTGYVAIRRFVTDIVNTSITRVYPLVAIGGVGYATPLPRAMEILEWVDPQRTAQAALDNRPAVVGIKVHLSKERSSRAKDFEVEFVKRALAAAEATHLPMMVHINGTYYPLPVTLKMLRKGDIFTHCFNAYPQDSPLDANGKILPEVQEARDRGVIFDVAEGPAHPHISFDVAEKCLQQGFLPDTLSTDLSGVHQYVTDLPTTISKFLALGMDLDKAIELVTIKPTQVFDFGVQIGTLRPGSEADIGIFELEEGRFEFFDGVGRSESTHAPAGTVLGGKRVGRQRLTSKAVVCRGDLFANTL